MVMTFQQFMANEASRTEHSFSATMVNLPPNLVKRIVAWGRRNVSARDVFHSQTDKSFGRETHPHITVLYGIHTEKAGRIRRALEGQKPFAVKLGKMSVFTTNDKFDVLKIEVKSTDLVRLNSLLKDSLYVTQTHPEYSPHVTIAYLEKGHGEKWNGDKTFDGEEFEISSIVFSSWKGAKSSIRLIDDTVLVKDD